jgi:hypothetical protein
MLRIATLLRKFGGYFASATTCSWGVFVRYVRVSTVIAAHFTS